MTLQSVAPAQVGTIRERSTERPAATGSLSAGISRKRGPARETTPDFRAPPLAASGYRKEKSAWGRSINPLPGLSGTPHGRPPKLSLDDLPSQVDHRHAAPPALTAEEQICLVFRQS